MARKTSQIVVWANPPTRIFSSECTFNEEQLLDQAGRRLMVKRLHAYLQEFAHVLDVLQLLNNTLRGCVPYHQIQP